jgi:DNA-binding Lrp family transcriptional regulator
MCKADPQKLLKDIAAAVGLSREAVRNRAKNVLNCYEIRSPILNR